MNLKSIYQRSTSFLLLATMIWNVMGWIGMGLVGHHMLEHAEGEHCEVSFCYCKIEDGEKICTCHHPELHALAKQKSPDHNHKEEPKKDSDQHEFCYYSKAHNSPVQSDQVIVMSDFRSLLLHSKDIENAYTTSDIIMVNNRSLTDGFEQGLFRPPSI